MNDDYLKNEAIMSEKEKSALVKKIQNIENKFRTGQEKIQADLQKVQQEEFEVGYNAAKNKFGNLFEEGVVDPAKVTRSGIQNATSIASMILTTECIIVDDVVNPSDS